MIYLIEYDRRRGHLDTFETFEDEELRTAETARLDLELRLNREGVEHEVVLLQARDEAALRRTHARYFATLRELTALLTA
jgi:hypothetical protein